jgi:hypothetical protein
MSTATTPLEKRPIPRFFPQNDIAFVVIEHAGGQRLNMMDKEVTIYTPACRMSVKFLWAI